MSDDKQKVVVIGAKGFIGQAVCRYFSKSQHFDVIEVDRDNYKTLVGVRADCIVNCNGNSRRFWAEENPVEDFDLNVKSVYRSLFDFVAPIYILLSTVDVYSNVSKPNLTTEDSKLDPPSVYGFHKSLAEQLVNRYASRPYIFRLATVIGQGLRKNPVYDLLNKAPIRIHPDSRLNLITPLEIAKTCELAMNETLPVGVYNIASTSSVSIREVAKELGAALSENESKKPFHEYEPRSDKIQEFLTIPKSVEAVRLLSSEER